MSALGVILFLVAVMTTLWQVVLLARLAHDADIRATFLNLLRW